MRKTLVLILSGMIFCILLVWGNMDVYASEGKADISSETLAGIQDAFSIIELDKTEYGLENVDFERLTVGNEIHMYEYTLSEMKELRIAYPVFDGEKLVALAIDAGNQKYQIMTILADKIRDLGIQSAAIVYDSEGCYAYNGDLFYLLGKNEVMLGGRKTISDGDYDERELNTLKLTALAGVISLDYVSSVIDAREQTYFCCNVSYITQQPYHSICWAATTATIVNYVKGVSLSAVAVAQARFGSTDFNHGLSADAVASFMNSVYQMGYTYHDYVPSNNVMTNNIQSGYPIYGSFTWTNGSSSGYHAVTVYGINVVSGYITIMDPEYGSVTCYYSNQGYTYVSAYSGSTVTFARANCKYW